MVEGSRSRSWEGLYFIDGETETNRVKSHNQYVSKTGFELRLDESS